MSSPKDKTPRFSDKKHLESLRSGFSCCVKLPNPSGGMPKSFGVVFGREPNTIHLRELNGDLCGNKIRFKSIDEMLREGWLVD